MLHYLKQIIKNKRLLQNLDIKENTASYYESLTIIVSETRSKMSEIIHLELE